MPEHLLKPLHPVIVYFNAFLLQQFLHHIGPGEMMPSAQLALPVYYPMRGHLVFAKTMPQRPAHHPRRTERQVVGNGAIGAHPAARNLAGNFIHKVKIVVGGRHESTNFVGDTKICVSAEPPSACRNITNLHNVIHIKASGITHLTDARYFAAKGVTWMGYCLDPASDQYIPPAKMQAIREWVDGVLTVGEMGFVSGDDLLDAVASYHLDAVQINMWVDAADLEPLQGRAEILREVVVLRDSDAAELQKEMNRMAHLITATVLSFAPQGITWADIRAGRPFGPDALRQLCSGSPVLLDIDVAPADMPELLAAVQPYGWVARGGEEERVGVKSYDDLDEIFEAF